MTPLHGKHFIAGELSAEDTEHRFFGANPANREQLEPVYHEATDAEIDHALKSATEAFDDYRAREPREHAAFLVAIGAEIDALGDPLIERAVAETGLGADRLKGERARTVNQLGMFSRLLEEGSWVQARIDHTIPDRKPIPKPDIRRMLVPIGPIVAFSASNFPLAISVAGNDTASGFAAGCPVIVKAHPAHPGTSELVAGAIAKAVKRCNMPAGIFSMLHGRTHRVGMSLVKHPLTRAVGFTGSLRAGRALFDAGAGRPEPIPVFAEMGSLNPVFLLPGALAERGEKIAEGLRQSVTLGVGQFCTCPNVVIGLAGEPTRYFADTAAGLMGEAAPATMLYEGIGAAYTAGVKKVSAVPGVTTASRSSAPASASSVAGVPTLFTADATTFMQHEVLREELFGPSTMILTASSKAELEELARGLEGHLTATIHGTDADLAEYSTLIRILEKKVGRIVFNGFPTGIEPCPSVHHGGPYPATTDARTTSIGTAAIERFVRPVCYQNFPQAALPAELKDENPRKIWRLVDGEMKRN